MSEEKLELFKLMQLYKLNQDAQTQFYRDMSKENDKLKRKAKGKLIKFINQLRDKYPEYKILTN